MWSDKILYKKQVLNQNNWLIEIDMSTPFGQLREPGLHLLRGIYCTFPFGPGPSNNVPLAAN